jgi:hypothetical protein
MKKSAIGLSVRTVLLVSVAIAAAAVAALLGPANPANAASSAVITIGQLEAQGFDVKIDRVGSAPLAQCEVIDVRNPRDQTRLVRVRDDLVPIVVRRTITVSLDCSR